MSEQDDIVTAYTNVVTTSADDLVATVLSYHQSIGTILFQIPELDEEHKEQIKSVDKKSLIRLRSRLDTLKPTLSNALQAGNF